MQVRPPPLVPLWRAPLTRSEWVVDLDDENWEVLLRTGTHNPLAEPLPEDTVWCISVYGKDQ